MHCSTVAETDRRGLQTPAEASLHTSSLIKSSSSKLEPEPFPQRARRTMDLNSPVFSCSSLSSDSEIYNVSSPESAPRPPRPKPKRPRSKNPSEQRRNASEKEKLRMRDLTDALHHLRTFLPPSVAPAGQALTKIETLRLAIRYISHLSSQLSQDAASRQSADLWGAEKQMRNKIHQQDVPPSRGNAASHFYQRKEPCAPHGAFNCRRIPVSTEAWRSGNVVTSQREQFRETFNNIKTETERKVQTEVENPLYEELSDSSFDVLMYPEASPSYQDYSKPAHHENKEFWT